MSDKDKGQGGRFSYIVDPLQHLAVPIDTLHPDASNARKHNEKNMDAIKESLHRFGQRIPIVVQKSNMVVRAGNGRLAAAKALGWSHIAAVIVDDSSVDAVSFAIADNRTAELAEWNKETLASLLDTMDDKDLKSTGFSETDLKDLLAELTPLGVDEAGEKYTQNIKAPIYEPKGERPNISELIDRTKTDTLIADIKKAGLPSEVSSFLISAAERHTVFNFSRIAEWYCHADPKTQDLMERSALVIIDFNKAIENGFVHMTNQIAKIVEAEEMEANNEG